MSGGADNSRAITMVVTMVAGLGAALLLGRMVATGDYTNIILIVGAVFGMLFILLLGDRYWYLIPVTIGLDLPTFPIGGRNINLSEISVVLCTGVYIVRLALKREELVLFRLRNAPIILYFSWVLTVWALHPVGLAGLGSEIGGGRFYATILLAFASFTIVSNRQSITEKDIKWIFGLLLVGTFANLGRTLLEYLVLGHTLGLAGVDVDTEGFYTWHQALASPAMLILMLLFSRYAPSQIISLAHPGRLMVFVTTIPPILLSGKRAAVGSLILIPLLSAMLRRQFHYIFIFGVSGFLFIGGLVIGQGSLFDLPMNVQRSLSWLPGEWDSSLKNLGSKDEFRKALRELAWEKIQRNPWMGDGFRVDINETAGIFYRTQQYGAPDIRDQVLPYAMGKAWHNTWLGYSADFGIPLAVIQFFLVVTALVVTYRVFCQSLGSVWINAMAMYCFIFFVKDVLTSWTSGHSALDTITRWWMYGMIFALVDQVIRNRIKTRQEKAVPIASAEIQTLA
jgi:hypothetical protein